MTIRKIAQMGEPVLRRRAEEIPPSEVGSARLRALVDDMIETMRDANGAGIAAPQVYESVRVCVVEVDENPRYPDAPDIPTRVFVNPVIEPLVPVASLADSDAVTMYEGCLSVAGIRGRVRRPRKVRVRAVDLEGRPIDEIWEGFSASVIQHETDHLDGVLFVDRADPRTLAFVRELGRHVPPEERFIDGGA